MLLYSSNKLDPNFEWFKFGDYCCGILHILGSNGLSNGTRAIQQGTVLALQSSRTMGMMRTMGMVLNL